MLQIALDVTDLRHAIDIVQCTKLTVERFEVGTPLILQHGMAAVRAVRSASPDSTIIADVKAMDGGDTYASMALGSGANGIIVQGAAPIATIAAASRTARKLGGFIMVDSLGMHNLDELGMKISALSVAHVVVHVGKDEQHAGATALDRLTSTAIAAGLPPIAVAGGLQPSTIAFAAQQVNADVWIVGEAIWDSSDPRQVVDEILLQLDPQLAT